ncbi:MAG: tyrosinase family protein, partial [Chloroflexota bacterium]
GEFRFASQDAAESIDGTPVSIAVPSDDPATDLMGTMAFNTSLNDPVFFLHHANIDRIWTQWAARHGNVYEPTSGAGMGMNANDMMWPYSMIGMHVTPNMALTTEAFGYVYE